MSDYATDGCGQQVEAGIMLDCAMPAHKKCDDHKRQRHRRRSSYDVQCQGYREVVALRKAMGVRGQRHSEREQCYGQAIHACPACFAADRSSMGTGRATWDTPLYRAASRARADVRRTRGW